MVYGCHKTLKRVALSFYYSVLDRIELCKNSFDETFSHVSHNKGFIVRMLAAFVEREWSRNKAVSIR